MHQSTSRRSSQDVAPGLLIGFGAIGALLVTFAAIGGVELGVYGNEIRLTLLDRSKADDYGYLDPARSRVACLDRPHGITQDQNSLMFLAGFVGTALLLVAYLAMAARLARVSPAWLGTALVAGPAAVGFCWHSTDWLAPDVNQDWNLAETKLYYSDRIVTGLLAAIFLIALLGYLRAVRGDLPRGDTAEDASLRS